MSVMSIVLCVCVYVCVRVRMCVRACMHACCACIHLDLDVFVDTDSNCH